MSENNTLTEEEEEAELKEAFNLFDKNGDGSISTTEIGTVLRALRQDPTDKELEEMIAKQDLNENGTIEYEEFRLMMAANKGEKRDPEKDLQNAFKVFDKDQNGFISKEELMDVLTVLGDQKLTVEEADEMFKVADMDGDGRIDYKEFCKVLLSK